MAAKTGRRHVGMGGRLAKPGGSLNLTVSRIQ
jgi:hypothetical protein